MSSVMIGVLKARLEAEAAQMKQEVQAVKKGITDLGEEGKKTSKSFTDLNSTMAKVAANSEHLKSIEQQLKKIDPAKMEQGFASVVVELQKMGAEKKQIEALEKALAEMSLQAQSADTRVGQLEQELKELAQRARDVEKVNEELKETDEAADKAGQSMQTLATGLAALGAGAATAKIVSLTKTLANEANQLANSYSGVSVVAEKFNVDASEAVDLADRLADRWGLGKDVLADTVKTYLSMNLTLEETEKIITSTADAAAYNREAHLSWGDAIKNVAQGIKAGNSNLTDSAGITTNLSVMQDRYAKSIGTTAAKLTEAQKIQAAYNGMLEEGSIFAGNADDAMTGYTGTQAAFNATLQEARTELGEAFLPVIEEILAKITPMIRGFAEWASANKDVVAGATAAGLALTSLVAVITTVIAVVGTLKIALDALKISLGPAGWVLLGISALATGVTAYSLAADAATESTWKFAQSQEELNNKLKESPLTRSSNDLKNLIADYDELNNLLERRKVVVKELAIADKAVYDGFFATDEEIARSHALQEELENIDGRLKELDLTAGNAEQSLGKMKEQIEASTPAMRELYNENLREIDALDKTSKEAGTLADRYRQLTSQTKLTKEQSDELTTIVRKLTERYPDLHTEMDEQGRLLIVNESLIRDLITAESESVDTMLAGERAKREALLATAQAALDSAEAQLKALEAVANAYQQDVEMPKLPEGVSEEAFAFRRKTAVGSITDAIQANYQLDGAQQLVADKLGEVNRLRNDLTIFDANWRDLIPDNSFGSSGSSGGTSKDKKARAARKKTAEELAREDYQQSLKYIQYKRDLNQMSEQQEIAALERLQKRYSKYGEIRQDTEVRIYKIKEQLAADEEKLREKNQKDAEKAEKERFAASSEWITQEERRMVLAGKSEEEIAQMKLEAWSRVRSRYDKDSEYYKQADSQLYNLRVSIIKQQTKAEQDAAKERETQLKDTTKQALDAIDKAKKAELSALDDRRKAIQKFYDDQNEAIDDSERLKERNELVAEMEKYRYATSEKGQKHFLELQEKLRKMDIEQQKRELDEQRDQELEALDKQKQDIEDYYNDLREATSDLTGDLTALYKLADDERLKSFIQTNELIKQEMANLQQALAESQAVAASSQADGVTRSVIAQMQANSAAWHTADATGKKRLEADNQVLGAQIGAIYKNGRWLLDGAAIYHTGGIAGEMSFQSEKGLLPDEIASILRRSETILTPQQVSSLVSAQGSSTSVHIEKFMEVNDPVFEDSIDLRAFGRETGDAAADLIRKQLAGGG